MQVECIQCHAHLEVQDEHAANPRVKLKCPQCTYVFPVVSAPRVQPTAPQPAPAQPAPAQPTGGVTQSAAAAASATTSRSKSKKKQTWKNCANHPTAWSERVCPECLLGYCQLCGTKAHLATICPSCDVLCIRPEELEQKLARERRKRIPLLDEISTIFNYPFSDLPTLIPLTAIYTLFAFGEAIGIFPANLFAAVFANGILMAYAFHAVVRVSDGDLKLQMPSLTDFGDILNKAILALAAWIISWGPLFLLSGSAGFGLAIALVKSFGIGGSSLAVAMLKILFGFAWLVVYAPAAVTVAAVSQSFVATINPLSGLTTIKRMGEVYWQVVLIFGVLQVGQFLVTAPFGYFPFFGTFVYAITQVFVWLATGCALGLAVDKRADELGLD